MTTPNDDNSSVKHLLYRYAAGEISKKEEEELFVWIKNKDHDEQLSIFLAEMVDSQEPDEQYNKEHWEGIIRQIVESNFIQESDLASGRGKGRTEKKWVDFWVRGVAAIIVVSLLSIGTYWLMKDRKISSLEIADVSARYKNDVPPGRNKAILTLGDSSKIVLNDVHKGKLAQQGGSEVMKLLDGKLAYSVGGKTTDEKIMYNTVSTPRGGQYEITLPDGTQVWLNAVSSLRFPTRFGGDKREVTLTGEAYFEVAKNPRKPFFVHIAFPGHRERPAATVRVLGTHFNIMAYEDEKTVNTSLFEGAVSLLRSSGNPIEIVPGQQVQLKNDNSVKIVHANDNAIAWKKGLFSFKSEHIQTIMRRAARWYDLKVTYMGTPTPDTFSGTISRSVNLSQLLKILEMSGVKFIIDGRKIIVMS